MFANVILSKGSTVGALCAFTHWSTMQFTRSTKKGNTGREFVSHRNIVNTSQWNSEGDAWKHTSYSRCPYLAISCICLHMYVCKVEVEYISWMWIIYMVKDVVHYRSQDTCNTRECVTCELVARQTQGSRHHTRVPASPSQVNHEFPCIC